MSIDGNIFNTSNYFHDGVNRLSENKIYNKDDSLSVIVKYEFIKKNNEIIKFYDSSNELLSTMPN